MFYWLRSPASWSLSWPADLGFDKRYNDKNKADAMSKFVKDLLTKDLQNRLEGVDDCVVADVIGLDANTTSTLRKRLREKGIGLMVVKNSLARRATEGTSLQNAFEGAEGTNAVLWGAEDFISLVKEVNELDKDDEAFEKFETRGRRDGRRATDFPIALQKSASGQVVPSNSVCWSASFLVLVQIWLLSLKVLVELWLAKSNQRVKKSKKEINGWHFATVEIEFDCQNTRSRQVEV